MNLPSIFLLAAGLSMDAFAVAVVAGLAMEKASLQKALIVGLWFGIFQAVMPVLGFFAGHFFADFVRGYSGFVAFGLLVFVGAKMIVGGFQKDRGENRAFSLHAAHMLPFALATSIDALAVGVSLAFLSEGIFFAALLIGVTTFAISGAGVMLGGLVGSKSGRWAQLAGGLVLVAMGIRILLDHIS